MRQLLSVLSLVLAGLLSAATLAGYQVDQLLRTEEPVRQIAGDLPQQEEFSDAVSEMIVTDLTSRLPAGLDQHVPGGVESMVSGIIGPLTNNERTVAAWDETLQTTRSTYTGQLERLFETGSTGEPQELAIDVDLSPVAAAITEPLREGLEQSLGWLPFIDTQSFEFLAPEIVVDIEAVTDEEADPYTWATAATASQYWVWFGIAAAALVILGLIIGPGKSRWVALTLGGLTAAGLGLWVATTAASPDFQHPAQLPQAAGVILEHVQTSYTEWSQPAWWIFAAAAGFVVVIGVLAAVVAPSASARRRHL